MVMVPADLMPSPIHLLWALEHARLQENAQTHLLKRNFFEIVDLSVFLELRLKLKLRGKVRR